MNDDRNILIEALKEAVRIYDEKKSGATLLGQPDPDSEVLDPISKAIEKCEVYKSVSGHVLFSAKSGVVLRAPALATPLLRRA